MIHKFLLLAVSVLKLSSAIEQDSGHQDRIWSIYNDKDNNSYRCGDKVSGIVKCHDEDNILWIQPCYCMYYDQTQNASILGNCMTTCFTFKMSNTGLVYNHYQRFPVQNASVFNTDMCETPTNTNREGRFCGKCKSGYGLAVYSYNYINCIPCKDYGYKIWLKYFAIALLPLTIFYILVASFRLNFTSNHLNGVILVAQCILSPVQQRLVAGVLYFNMLKEYMPRNQFIATNVVISIFSIVNLDFFRAFYTDICLHPSFNILHVASLDFLIALYPFLLMILTYLLIKLYDRNCILIVWAWKPFQWCLKWYHGKLPIRNSLIETFATFILLSYVKILGICFDILMPTKVFDSSGHLLHTRFLYYDASIEYFSSQHIPFAVLALCIGFVFLVLPFLLLLVYPCRCFHRCLNFIGYRGQMLHVFMDAFQGSYKIKPYDLRYFSAYFLLLRFLFLVTCLIFPTAVIILMLLALLLLGAIIVLVFQPYQNNTYNRWDTVCILLGANFYLGVAFEAMVSSLNQYWLYLSGVFWGIGIGAFFIIYVTALLWGIVSPKKMWNLIMSLFNKCRRKQNRATGLQDLISPGDDFDEDQRSGECSLLITNEQKDAY